MDPVAHHEPSPAPAQAPTASASTPTPSLADGDVSAQFPSASTPTSAAAAAAAARRLKNGPITANACIACRKVKMKCVFEEGESICKRCIRLKCECVLEKHRRGRKVGTKLNRSHGKVIAQPPPQASSPAPIPTSNPRADSMNPPSAQIPTLTPIPIALQIPTGPYPTSAPQLTPAYSARPAQDMSTPVSATHSNPHSHSHSHSLSYSNTPIDTLKTESPAPTAMDGPTPGARSTNASTGSVSGSSIWSAAKKGFQPPDLLSEQATSGKFSLKTILSVEDEEVNMNSGPDALSAGNAEPYGASAAKLSFDAANDPIIRGLVSLSVARSLFGEFMRKFNPWIAQFDPTLHTFEYVRSRSAFLLTSILAAAAKAFNPPLKKPLQELGQSLLADAFIQGTKSVEIVHAILVMTYWKEPDDTRAWLLTGYIIRMCMELGWHKLPFKHGEDDEDRDEEERTRNLTEMEIRQERDVERLWLLLFVYDRSISLQTGKPWMIERSDFIIDSTEWHTHALATHNDKLLCGFVSLRLLTSETLKLVHPKFLWRGPRSSHLVESEVLLESMEADLQRWRNRWTQVCSASSEKCHAFLIRFYGAHLRLSFYSIPLQPSMVATINIQAFDKRPLWVCFASAREMLQLLADPEVQPSLYFCQDSIHVMTAYATAFLLKVCLSGGGTGIHASLQVSVIEALRSVSTVFKQHMLGPDTGCALQAKFLENVLCEFEKKATWLGREDEQYTAQVQVQVQAQAQAQAQVQVPTQYQPQQQGPAFYPNQYAGQEGYQNQHPQPQPQPQPQLQNRYPESFPQQQQQQQQQGMLQPQPAQGPAHTQQQQQQQQQQQPSSNWPPLQQELPHMSRLPNANAAYGETTDASWQQQQPPPPPQQQPQPQPQPQQQQQQVPMGEAGYPPAAMPAQPTQAQQTEYFGEDFVMNDDPLWESMIANAGFDVTTGVFMPMSLNR